MVAHGCLHAVYVAAMRDVTEPFPPAFSERMRATLGTAESERLLNALQDEAPVSVRMNPFREAVLFPGAVPVPWCAAGRYLDMRPSFTSDPAFHSGAYYVQEASSMFLDHVIRQLEPQPGPGYKVLDLCAAPGGKSTLLSSWLKDRGLLVSNEIIRSRVSALSENMTRWGQANVLISNNDPANFASLEAYFDLIVVDAPCSGEGLFRKDPGARREWSPGNAEVCSARQQRILNDVLPALKPGGTLIYSTCTFNPAENEAIVNWLKLSHEFVPVPLDVADDFGVEQAGDDGCSWKLLPHKLRGEGFFIACLRKPGEYSGKQKFRQRSLKFLARAKREVPMTWLEQPGQFDYFEWGDHVYAFDADQITDLTILSQALHLRNAGIRMGEIKHDELVPAHELALSIHLSQFVKTLELSREEAIRFLRKDSMQMPVSSQRGFQLVTWQHRGLGWVKILPNRINNYLPPHLRILAEV
jgi:16S rRNA C967 or C1407 C5-methylase (RsmB/RsmF family)/NOL1/NOP2/fmu family ribosome biogenesis protein